MSVQLQTLLANIPLYAGLKDAYCATHLPIYNTATFDMKRQGFDCNYDYSRSGNPTRNAIEKVFAIAENGATCCCVNSGISAVKLLFETVLKQNDHLLVEKNYYGGTFRLLKILKEKYNIHTHFADFTQEKEVAKILSNFSIKLTLCESPTNPALKIINLKKISNLCKEHNSLFAVDNSMATFASQIPILLGADFSVFSCTKFISGHGSITAGALVSKTEDWGEKIAYIANADGIAQAPFDAFIMSLGLPTLIQRMKNQEKTAKYLASNLELDDDVEIVNFPGLPSHPQYELAKEQLKIIPAIITLKLKQHISTEKFIENLNLFGHKVSFGCADSRIEIPAKMSHASLSEEDLVFHDIDCNLVRISVGLEDALDLLNDIKQAIKKSSVSSLAV